MRSRAPATSSVTQTGRPTTTRGSAAAGGGGGLLQTGHHVAAERAHTGHPRHRPVGPSSGQVEHLRSESSEYQAGGGHGEGQRDASGDAPPGRIGAPLIGQQRSQRFQLLGTELHDARIGDSVPALGHRRVGDADTESDPTGTGGVSQRQGLLGQRDGMTTLDRHHGRADMDASDLAGGHGQGGQGVDARRLRKPDALEALVRRRPDAIDHVVDGGGVAAAP